MGGVLLNSRRNVPQFVKGATHATERFPQLLETRVDTTMSQEAYGVDPVFSMTSLLYDREQVRVCKSTWEDSSHCNTISPMSVYFRCVCVKRAGGACAEWPFGTYPSRLRFACELLTMFNGGFDRGARMESRLVGERVVCLGCRVVHD